MLCAVVVAVSSVAVAVQLPTAPGPPTTAGTEQSPRALLPDGRRDPAYVSGQIVVKLNSSVTACLARALAAGRRLRSITADGSDSLEKLQARHGVTAARPVFRGPAQEPRTSLADLRRAEDARAAAAAGRFPARAARAARDAVLPDLSHVYVVDVTSNADPAEIARDFARDPHVAYAHPNYLVRTQFTPNDPYFASSGSWGQPYADLWGLARIQMAQAWDLSRGAGITVAVVDTGLDAAHEDIAGNVWTNAGETPGNGMDDDGNGYVDDASGWDFTTCDAFDFFGNCTVPKSRDADPADENGHGTHVAGTVAAVGDNGVGVIGVAPEAKIMAVRGLNGQGSGVIGDLAAAIRYAADNGADVLNNSWSGSGADDLAADAVAYAHGLGCVVVAAAGNNHARPVPRVFPAGLPQVIAATALGPTEAMALFSNRGITVDVAAPGVDVLSLRAAGTDLYGDGSRIVGERYLRADGTSMAAPHVAGVAALILARHPAFTNVDVQQAIRTAAEDFYQPADLASRPGWDVYSGHGVVQAAATLAVTAVPTARITGPARGALFTNTDQIEILGTAGGPGFARYAIEVTRLTAGYSWTTVHSGVSPVTDGVLATWSTASWPDGGYYVQLVVHDAAGSRAFDRTELVLIREGTLPPGSPVILDDAIASRSPIAADLDDDGRQEIAISSGNWFFYSPSTNLYLLEANGTVRWQKTFDGWISAPTLADLDGDAQEEVIVYESTTPLSLVHAFRADGSVAPGWPQAIPPANGLATLSVSVGDLDGDGQPEVVVPVPFFPLVVLRANGALVGSFFNRMYGPSAIADLNGDGAAEVVVINNLSPSPRGKELSVLTFDGTQFTEMPGWPRTVAPPDPVPFVSAGLHGPVVGDLDADGSPEVVLTIEGVLEVRQATGSPRPGWPQTMNRPDDLAFPALGDLDGDGTLEIVAPTYATGLYVFREDGSRSIAPLTYGDAAGSSPLVVDLDGNGDGEVVFNAGTWTHLGVAESVARVYAFDYHPITHALLPLWTRTTTTANGADDYLLGAALVADLDGDSLLDLFSIAPMNPPNRTALFRWELALPFAPEALVWPMGGHDPRQTNALPFTPRPGPDRYMCDTVRVNRRAGGASIVPRDVGLRDRFGAVTCRVSRERAACPAAVVDGRTPEQETVHQLAYRLRCGGGFPAGQDVVVRDEFNAAGVTVTLRRRHTLLVPAGLAIVGNPPPPAPPPYAADHFLCHAVRPLGGAAPVPATVTDLVAPGGYPQLVIEEMTRLCAPVDVDGSDPSAPDRRGHLACYRAQLPFGERLAPTSVTADNAIFGQQVLRVRRTGELCVPASVEP
jgi:subtilisin family serine protease